MQMAATNVAVRNEPMLSHTRRRENGVYYTRMLAPERLRPIIGKSDLGHSPRAKEHREMMRPQPIWLSEGTLGHRCC